MKNFYALALSMMAASLCADNATTESSEYARASLFGENDKNMEEDNTHSEKPHYTRASLFGEEENNTEKRRHRQRRPSSDVYLASPPTTFELEFTSLILQPTTSNLHYGAQSPSLAHPQLENS